MKSAVLHMPHFVFLEMHVAGGLSYSSAWHLTYLGVFSNSLFRIDVLAGSRLSSCVPDDQLKQLELLWKGHAGRVAESAIMAQIRLGFAKVV